MAWGVTREGVLRAGLYDKNFFPAYYEDDDYVLRMLLAGLEVEAVHNFTAFHGLESSRGYLGGVLAQGNESQKVMYKLHRHRGDNPGYIRFKWGKQFRGFSYKWTTDQYQVMCSSPSNGRFCNPYGKNNLSLSFWSFYPVRRHCILTGEGISESRSCGGYLK